MYLPNCVVFVVCNDIILSVDVVVVADGSNSRVSVGCRWRRMPRFSVLHKQRHSSQTAAAAATATTAKQKRRRSPNSRPFPLPLSFSPDWIEGAVKMQALRASNKLQAARPAPAAAVVVPRVAAAPRRAAKVAPVAAVPADHDFQTKVRLLNCGVAGPGSGRSRREGGRNRVLPACAACCKPIDRRQCLSPRVPCMCAHRRVLASRSSRRTSSSSRTRRSTSSRAAATSTTCCPRPLRASSRSASSAGARRRPPRRRTCASRSLTPA